MTGATFNELKEKANGILEELKPLSHKSRIQVGKDHVYAFFDEEDEIFDPETDKVVWKKVDHTTFLGIEFQNSLKWGWRLQFPLYL